MVRFRYFQYIIFFIVILFLANPALANPAFANPISANQKNTLTFNEYIELLKEHPKITAILAESDKFKELSVGEIGLPDPDLIVGVDNLPINDLAFDRFLPTSKTFGFQQKIPSYELREAKSMQQANLSVKQKLLADYSLQRLQAIFIAELSALEKVKKQIKYAERQLKYYKALEEYFKGKLESGGAVYWRFSEIDVERSVVEQKLNDFRAEKDGVEAKLVRLVGEVPNISIPDISQIKWDNNPEIIYPVSIAKEGLSVADKGVKIADSAFNSNYSINALYKKREDGQNFSGDDWFSLKATISIPLWTDWNQKPKLRAAKANKYSAEMSYNDTKRIWISKLVNLASSRDATFANIKVFEERDAAIGEMVEAAQRNYEAGNASLESVLDAQINQLTIKSQLAKQHSRYMKLLAEFNSHIIGSAIKDK